MFQHVTVNGSRHVLKGASEILLSGLCIDKTLPALLVSHISFPNLNKQTAHNDLTFSC